MIRQLLQLGYFLILLAVCAGCNFGATQKQSRESANQAYREGLAAFAAEDYHQAVEKFTTALEGGWLGYSAVDAYVKRAISNAHLGNFESALEDLSLTEQGGGASAEVLAARSYIFEKQGKTAEARALWAQARQLDPRIEKIVD